MTVPCFIMPSGETRFLGRRPPNLSTPRLHLGAFLSPQRAESLPASVDYATKAMPSIRQTLGNTMEGDCHDDQTEVLTEQGWKRWTDYDGSLLLGTVNPNTLL